MQSLTETQRRYLRRMGHDLKPVVRTGSAGLTEGVLTELERALHDHELVKVKLVADDRAQRRAFIERIVEATGAVEVQAIGHVALFYRRNPERREPIALP
ncbi:RNA-binding protein YhbY [wastewater metagenome]|uniref:RNA-binding protein YhbY n=2 Tax=unclassified sequences TaxID=12908 RepID=A0A5B8RBI7_9ZZZZ|nr:MULTISPECIES: ribosome assembly RNA-binding protein YhbY [Arhodomonas]MCS4504686.1 ribosome assembly RNA-binding protein YhbY [Arhodomonas aquaeolei]QEA04047.1 RNA-binding protein YhbY [uncultured organism]